ncbi:MAG: hypothetical protein LBU82_00450 [Treponema sp.]|jgi:hypothetical protein|nr:hypothetical protein [Treponema sp.]
MKIKFRETMPPMRGYFNMRVYRKGTLIEEYREKNMIVSGARTAVANHLMGDCAGGHIAKIAFGTSVNVPTPDDTIIANPFTKPLLAASLLTPTQVEFKWNLLKGEANGKKIIEFGLLCENGTLFARKVRSEAIPKEADIYLEGEWIITL